MRKRIMLVLVVLAGMAVQAQTIKGPESISYFQAPSQGVKFETADVYVLTDLALQEAKAEEQKAKNSAMGGKLGSMGNALANTVNSVIDYSTKLTKALDALKDDKGRFAYWSFVPSYIIATPELKSNVIVEIFVLNEENPSPGAGMQPLKADKNGYYDIPYYINCRYKVSTKSGDVLMEKNLGILEGTQKSKHYTPPTPGQGGGPGGIGAVTVQESDELTESEKIGINAAYKRVRQDVYGQYGFGVFYAPIKLGVVKEIKESKKMVEPILDIFQNKRGILLNDSEKAQVQAFVDVLENNLAKCSPKTKWVALHNLSVCYAWLENPEKAKESYARYTEEIKETIDKMEKWNLALQGKLPKEDRKGLFIGMKDMKKFRNYNDIETFVNYYPAGAHKYEKMFKTLNRELAKFVDYYSHNDLLCQLYEIDYPFQFFPLQDFAGAPKRVDAAITKDGMEPINYSIRFDGKRRIKQVETEQIGIGEDGTKEKLYSRELKPVYDEETGEHLYIETDAGMWAREMAGTIYFTGMNKSHDPIAAKTESAAKNITKKAGIFADKTSDEMVQLMVDLNGNLYFNGKSQYFKANAIFKDIISKSGIQTKRSDTKSNFNTKATINDQGVFTMWSWDGDVTTSFVSALASAAGKTQSITADRMLRQIEVLEQDDKGNPTKVQYTFEMKGKLKVSQKMSMKEWFTESYAQGSAPKNKISAESFEIGNNLVWDCEFKYDEQGNWIEMKVGPYTASRTFKY
ncbi:MAG: hypothetical protein K9I34_02790 [Bacteroidales bacterium]|nr:hypothetical protein [Bacteroidales bacterium]